MKHMLSCLFYFMPVKVCRYFFKLESFIFNQCPCCMFSIYMLTIEFSEKLFWIIHETFEVDESIFVNMYSYMYVHLYSL